MLFHSLWVLVLLFCNKAFGYHTSQRVIRQSNDSPVSCTTADGQAGNCINLKRCSHLRNTLISVPVKPELRTFLEKSLCGREEVDKYPKVCCSVSKRANFFTITPPSTKTLLSSSGPVSTDATPASNGGIRLFGSASTDVSTKNNFSICGKTNRTTWKIIGGTDVSLGDWPWMAAIGYSSSSNPDLSFRCGGSIISDRWVITAAHCLLNIGQFKPTIVRLGELNLEEGVNDGAFPVDIGIEKTVTHPDYTPSSVQNDVALLGLNESIVFTSQIRPICILSGSKYTDDNFYHNKAPFVSGWGSTQWRGPMSKTLQEARLDIVDRESCAASYKNLTINIGKTVLCATKNKKDSCQGDSGGPLMLPVKSSYYIAGIVSFGVGCGNAKYPGVYTRVAQFSDWISNMTGIELAR